MLGTLLLMLSACVVDSSHVAVMSSGSLLRFNLQPTVDRIVRPMVQEGHQVEYFIALVTGSRTTWRPSVASHDISPDPSFSSRLSIRETLQLHVQAAGGTLAHLELRSEIMIDADPRLKARRDLARKLWPDEIGRAHV